MNRFALLFAFVAVTAGCSSPASAPAPTTASNETTAAIVHVHSSRCGTCHTPVEPGERSRAVLEDALARHRRRVRLSEADWAKMVDYLASRGPGAPPATVQ
jgi:hypothetical protein